MALLVDLANYTFGVASAETSFEIKNHTVRVAPEFKTYAFDRVNAKKGFAVGPGELTITQQGEISAATGGWWDFTFSAPCVLANAKTYFGVGATGDAYLDEGTITMTSDGFKSLDMSFSLNAAITGTGS